jgi:predicted Zn-dependent peptidase
VTGPHRLSNGMRIVCDPMPGLKTFALTVMARGGARWEDESRSGWSHLLEHLVFKGAGDMGAREIVERIEGVGGSINAATGYERTSFDIRAMEGCLPLAMQVVSDLMLRPWFEPEEIEREKAVVAQEIAEAFDTPDDHVFDMAQSRAFTDQPLGRPILGSTTSLTACDRSGAEEWRARLYGPERLVLVVSGAVEEDELLQRAEAMFGAARSGLVDEAGPAPARFVGGEARLARRIEQANLVFQLPGLAVDDPDLAAMRLFVEILGGGMASRLFQSAREERGLAYAIDAYHEAYEDAGVLGIYAGAGAAEASELAGVAADELRALAVDGPREAELARAKAVLSASVWMGDENPAGRAARLAAQTLAFGRPTPSEETIARLTACTTGDLRRLGMRLLETRISATAVLGPRAALDAGGVFSTALGQA